VLPHAIAQDGVLDDTNIVGGYGPPEADIGTSGFSYRSIRASRPNRRELVDVSSGLADELVKRRLHTRAPQYAEEDEAENS